MIYFDNAATTFLNEDARQALLQNYANASSPHAIGLEAERAIKSSAKDISKILSCQSDEIIFTSGGTESNNMGLIGAALALKAAKGKNQPLRILASNQEHPSVTGPLQYLASLPGFEIVYAHPSDWEYNEDTALVCLTQVSSETGDIFDVSSLERNKPPGVKVFMDGAQGFCKFKLPAWVDIYTFSGHKVHGPTGVGGMMVRSGLRLQPLLYGGGQQKGLRPGTENVRGIVAMAAAAKTAAKYNLQNQNVEDAQTIKKLEDIKKTESIKKIESIKNIINTLSEELEDVYINQLEAQASSYILNMSFVGINGETLTNALSSKGVYISMGTACRNLKGNLKKESALATMGISKERAASAVRFSFSYQNTIEEAVKAKEIIKECVELLRKATYKAINKSSRR